jgi:hypothetical protein
MASCLCYSDSISEHTSIALEQVPLVEGHSEIRTR